MGCKSASAQDHQATLPQFCQHHTQHVHLDIDGHACTSQQWCACFDMSHPNLHPVVWLLTLCNDAPCEAVWRLGSEASIKQEHRASVGVTPRNTQAFNHKRTSHERAGFSNRIARLSPEFLRQATLSPSSNNPPASSEATPRFSVGGSSRVGFTFSSSMLLPALVRPTGRAC